MVCISLWPGMFGSVKEIIFEAYFLQGAGSAGLHTKEKRRGNTREEMKFDAGCAAWAWGRVQWESHVTGS